MNDFIQTALTDATSDARSFVVGEATTVIVPPEVFQEPTYTVSVSPSTVVEGGEFVVRAVTTNLSNSTTLFVTVGGTGSAVSDDFGVNHWSMVINNNKGVVRLSPKIDSILESGETVQFQLRTVRATGPIVATTSLALITDIPAPVQPPALPPRPPAEPFPADPVEPPGPTKTYSISVSPTTLVEGSYNLVAIYTTNVPDGTQLFVTVGGSGNATSNDFIGYPLTTTVANGNASRTVFAILDGIVETETVQFELRTGSPTGPIVATSGLLSVLDNAGGGGQPPIDNSTYFAMVSPTVADEGNSFVVTVATSGVANGTVLYMTQSGTTSDSDFIGSPWTLTVSNNEATATVATVADGTSEGNEIAVFHIRTGSAAGPIVATTPSVTIRNPGSNAASYSISASPAIVGEGGTVNVTVTTTNVPNGTILFIGLDSSSSTGYSDFIGAPWAITINNNLGSRTITINSDNVAESNETFQFNLKTGSPSGTVVAVANTVTIDATLSASTYSIGSIPSSLNEGDVFVVSVTTTNVANGTILYLTKSDSSSVSNNDFVSLPKSITINNGTGSTSLSLKNDVTTEGAESAQFVLRTGSITGPVVATTTSVNIVDTSTTSTPPVEQFDSLLTTRLAGKSPIGVYYESWGDFTLANINPPVNVVNIAHVQPNCSYVAGSLSFVGSNLGFFSNTFAEVKAAITTLKSKGIIVLLSIGALSSNPFNLGTYNPASIISLCDDLGCDGVDLDWESPIDNTLFGPLIQATRNAAGSTRIVTAAVVSTGAYGTGSYVSAPPLGSVYSNLNRPGLVSHGTLLDGINIMAYDSSTALSTTQCIDSYADCYAGPLIVGFQVPPEGWGDHVVTLPEVTSVVSYIRELSPTNGFFVWSYKKIGTPTAQQIIDTGAGVLPPVAQQFRGMFWQTLNDNVGYRRDWQRLGITKTVFQWVAVDGQSFIPQAILPLHFGQLNLTDIATYPWASEIIIGLVGHFTESAARTNVANLANLAEQFGALNYPSNVKGFYFPVEIDPTWTDFATVMAPLWSKLPRPLYMSLYYGPAFTDTAAYANTLASILPSDVHIMFQDGVGAHGYSTATALARFEQLKTALGANRVSLIAEAFRVNPSGTPAFISATASQLQTQLTAYAGLPIWLFDGPTYLTAQLINDIAGAVPELLAPTGLTAVRSSGDDIKLSWSRNSASTHSQNQSKVYIYTNDGNNTLLRTITVNGNATTAYYLAEEAIQDYGFPASYLTWAVRELDVTTPITGALSTVYSNNVALDNSFVTHAVIFAGQSNSAGHFYGPLSTLNGKTSSAVFRTDLAIGLNIPPATLTVVNAAVGNTAAEYDADATAGDLYHWWNLTTNQPGPTMLEFETKVAGVLGKNIVGIVWAQGETDVGGGALEPPTSTATRFVSALTAIFNRMRSVLGSATVPIWFQPLARSYWPVSGVLLDVNGKFFKEYRNAQITLASSDPHIRIGAWVENGGQSNYVLESGALLHYTASVYHDLAAQLAVSMSTQLDRIASPPAWTTLQVVNNIAFTVDGSGNVTGTWNARSGVTSWKVYSFRVDTGAHINTVTVNTNNYLFTAAQQTAIYGFAGVSVLVYIAEVGGLYEGPPVRFFGTPVAGGGGSGGGSSTIAYVTNTQPSQNNPFYNQSISVRYSVVAASNLSVYSRLLVREGSGNIINTNYAGYYDSVCTRTSTDSGVTWSSWTYLSGPNGTGVVTDGFLSTIATGTYLLEIRVIKSTTFALPASWEFDIELTDTGWSSNGTHLINNIPFVLGTA